MICAVIDCLRTVKARGWCNAHYQRWWKTGNPVGVRSGRWESYERPVCSVESCDRMAHARGLCTIHYPRQKRHGDPLRGRRRNATGSANVRFLTFIDVGPDGCWLWNGATITGGYGEFTIDGRTVYAHRWAYEHWRGPIPGGLTIDHLCHNRDLACTPNHVCDHRRCVNPQHMEPVTTRENFRRGIDRAKRWRAVHR